MSPSLFFFVQIVFLDQRLELQHPSIKVFITELWHQGKNVLKENQVGVFFTCSCISGDAGKVRVGRKLPPPCFLTSLYPSQALSTTSLLCSKHYVWLLLVDRPQISFGGVVHHEEVLIFLSYFQSLNVTKEKSLWEHYLDKQCIHHP